MVVFWGWAYRREVDVVSTLDVLVPALSRSNSRNGAHAHYFGLASASCSPGVTGGIQSAGATAGAVGVL